VDVYIVVLDNFFRNEFSIRPVQRVHFYFGGYPSKCSFVGDNPYIDAKSFFFRKESVY